MKRSTYEVVRDLVLANAFDPDEPLTEMALAERLGVSRTPIREALKLLENDGLVERAGRGLRIRERSSEEILEIYEVRVTLEAAAARGAAMRRTDLDLSRLAIIHDEMIALGESELDARIRSNTYFHETLWKASHNATLQDLMKRLMTQLQRYPQSTLAFPGRWDVVLTEHAALIKAITERDAELSSGIATDHMTVARDTRLRMFARAVDSSLPWTSSSFAAASRAAPDNGLSGEKVDK